MWIFKKTSSSSSETVGRNAGAMTSASAVVTRLKADSFPLASPLARPRGDSGVPVWKPPEVPGESPTAERVMHHFGLEIRPDTPPQDREAYRATGEILAQVMMKCSALVPSELYHKIYVGKLELDSWLNGGQFGTVFVARKHPVLPGVDELLALKLQYSPEMERNEESKWMILAAHPCVIDILSIISYSIDTPIIDKHRRECTRIVGILMPKMDASLEEVIHDMTSSRTKYHLEERTLYKWGAQILLALEQMHHSGMVHCDLKPANILIRLNADHHLSRRAAALASSRRILAHAAATLASSASSSSSSLSPATSISIPMSTPGRRVFVADFGLVTPLDADGLCRVHNGTTTYMAPEVLDGLPFNGKADVWSAGVVLLALATGKAHPFWVSNKSEAIRNAVLNKTPLEEISERHYSKKLKELIMTRMLAPAEDRPTAKQILMWDKTLKTHATNFIQECLKERTLDEQWRDVLEEQAARLRYHRE